MTGLNIGVFIGVSILSRGIRFFVVCWLNVSISANACAASSRNIMGVMSILSQITFWRQLARIVIRQHVAVTEATHFPPESRMRIASSVAVPFSEPEIAYCDAVQTLVTRPSMVARSVPYGRRLMDLVRRL